MVKFSSYKPTLVLLFSTFTVTDTILRMGLELNTGKFFFFDSAKSRCSGLHVNVNSILQG